MNLQTGNNKSFNIYLKNISKKDFKLSFDLFFSKQKVKQRHPVCDFKTKLEVIKKLGFPTKLRRTGTDETWTLGLGYTLGGPCGYEIAYIEIRKGKVRSLSGEI